MNSSAIAVNNRREFLAKAATMLGVTICACGAGQFLTACEHDVVSYISTGITFPVDFTKLSVYDQTIIAQIGSGIKQLVGSNNGGNGVLIIRIGDDSVAADKVFLVVTAICSHDKGVLDPPTADYPNILCEKHFAEFSATDATVLNQGQSGGGTVKLHTFTNTYDKTTKKLTINF